MHYSDNFTPDQPLNHRNDVIITPNCVRIISKIDTSRSLRSDRFEYNVKNPRIKKTNKKTKGRSRSVEKYFCRRQRLYNSVYGTTAPPLLSSNGAAVYRSLTTLAKKLFRRTEIF